MEEDIFREMKGKMEKALSNLRHELGKIRTGRASLSILDDVKVESYGTLTPLNQVATLSVPESKMITIQPWDGNILPAIEKAIINSGLGLTPNNDGKIIRINIPPLTEERRKEFVKVAKKIAEESKISVRSARRDANELLKTLEKEKEISQDELKKAQAQVQEITNEYIARIDEVLDRKEEDILKV